MKFDVKEHTIGSLLLAKFHPDWGVGTGGPINSNLEFLDTQM